MIKLGIKILLVFVLYISILSIFIKGGISTTWRYVKYVLEHKKNVFKICIKRKMYVHAFLHDISKFSPIEFIAYANKFSSNPGDTTLCNWYNPDFQKAWQHHKDRNKHHWDYWYERSQPMPIEYIEQMIVDWDAMGIKFNNTSRDFYIREKANNKILFADETTRKIVESKLGIYN